jgi:cell division protein FtsQ
LTHVDRAVVRAALVGHLHGNFFTMHLGETRRALESIPWVARVTVRRVWPGRIEILLTERHPIGIWSDGRLLSDEGVLFDGNLAEPDANKGAMNFSAPPDMAAIVVASIPGYVQRLGNMKMTLSGIDVSNRMSWTVHAREGASLILGRDDPPGTVMTRLDDIVQHYPQVIERTGSTPRRIDARYNNGFAVSKS